MAIVVASCLLMWSVLNALEWVGGLFQDVDGAVDQVRQSGNKP